MVRMVRMVRSLTNRTYQLWSPPKDGRRTLTPDAEAEYRPTSTPEDAIGEVGRRARAAEASANMPRLLLAAMAGAEGNPATFSHLRISIEKLLFSFFFPAFLRDTSFVLSKNCYACHFVPVFRFL